MSLNIFEEIAIRMIKEQELIIGPLAWIEASKVTGMKIHEQGVVSIDSPDKQGTIDKLVGRYERLFGKASHEVCKQAVLGLIAGLQPAEIPSSLR